MRNLIKRAFLVALSAALLSGCTEQNVAAISVDRTVSKVFTKDDFKRIQSEVAEISKSISYAISKSNNSSDFRAGRFKNSSNSTNALCNSVLANQYSTNCFTGYFSDSYINETQNIAYVPIHNALSNNLDENVNSGFENFGINNDPSYFLNQTQLTSKSGSILSELGNEQASLADSLQNLGSMTNDTADVLMTNKVFEQENRVLNNPSLSYEDKEYILTILELQLQNKENYMNQYENRFDNSNAQARKRSFLGKLWRGLAFVAITVATAGKAAIFIAKAAYLIAGKSALWAAGGVALKSTYFAVGVAAAWIPTNAELINKEKWNSNPWGSGSFSDILKFGSGVIGVITNPLFGWAIV